MRNRSFHKYIEDLMNGALHNHFECRGRLRFYAVGMFVMVFMLGGSISCRTAPRVGHKLPGLWRINSGQAFEVDYLFTLLLKPNGEGAWLRGWRAAFPDVVTYKLSGKRLIIKPKFRDGRALDLYYDADRDVLRSVDGAQTFARCSDAWSLSVLTTIADAKDEFDEMLRWKNLIEKRLDSDGVAH